MKSLWIHRFTTVFTPCKPLNLSRFWKFLGFQNFWTQTRSKSYGSMLIQICCGSLSMKRWVFDSYLCLFRRFELKFLGILGSDSVLLISGLSSENKSVNFVLLLLRFKNLWIFPSSSQIRASVIGAWACCLWVVSSHFELQKNRFNDEDSMLNLWESMQTPLNLLSFWFWKVLGFFHDPWWFSVLIHNCIERECEFC